jgi:phosphoribosyl-AMP cyclohydrolase
VTGDKKPGVTLEARNEDGSTEQVTIEFGPDGLLPVVVQEDGSKMVLLVAFMNREAFDLTRQTGLAHFWSRSRQQLWLKGATSGDYLKVTSLAVNCEENSLLVTVTLLGQAACHTGHKSCYYRELVAAGPTQPAEPV